MLNQQYLFFLEELGWSIELAKRWIEAGWCKDLDAANDWFLCGWDPEAAMIWYFSGWRDPLQALAWKEIWGNDAAGARFMYHNQNHRDPRYAKDLDDMMRYDTGPPVIVSEEEFRMISGYSFEINPQVLI